MQHTYRDFFCRQAVSLLVSLVCFVPCLRAETGYVCYDLFKYKSCKNGFYLSHCEGIDWESGPSEISESQLVAGNSCKQCPDNYKCVGELACPVPSIVTCADGQYLDKYKCADCLPGHYCGGATTFNVSGEIQGIYKCSPGTYNPNSKANSVDACKTCEGGYYCGEASAEQTPCDAGYFCPQGSKKQTECGVGYYCPEKSANHNSCPAGTTTSTATSAAKTECYISSATKFKDKNGEFVLPINYNIYVK